MGHVKNQPLEPSDSSDCYNSIHLGKHTHTHIYMCMCVCVCVCVCVYIYIYKEHIFLMHEMSVKKKELSRKKQ